MKLRLVDAAALTDPEVPKKGKEALDAGPESGPNTPGEMVTDGADFYEPGSAREPFGFEREVGWFQQQHSER